MHRLSLNLPSAFLDPRIIDDILSDNLVAGRIFQVLSSPLFVCFSLGLVPKGKSGFRKIHHFFFPPDFSVIDHIPKETVHLHYTKVDDVLGKFVAAKRHCAIRKHKIEDVFCNIPWAPYI